MKKHSGKHLAFGIAAFLPLLLLSCDQLSSPPNPPSTKNLALDSLGIWRSTDSDSLPFMDMPLAYRDFWRYCANCHSSSGQSSQAPRARKALHLNTWNQITAYGAEKLILAAKGGGMPLPPTPRVSDEVLGRAQAYLASWPDSAQPIRVTGYRYAEAGNFVRSYCADCHTPGGRSADQPKAAIRLMLDNYEGWRKHQSAIKQRLDTNNLLRMPPQDSHQDSLLSRAPPERARMIDWIDRFSPNTADGTGKGDDTPLDTAVKGLVYEPAFRIINRYCAECHTEGGLNLRQLDGWTALPLDTYGNWKSAPDGRNIFARRLDSVQARQSGLERMPPPKFYAQPTQAERDTLLNWLQRGSPNTLNGQ